ncbi:hypothetical protein REPUB_Repub07fG0016700 [Reevesia pubescens]
MNYRLCGVPLLDANKMALESQASHSIVPAFTCSSDPAQSLAAMQEKKIDEHDQNQLSGFIFMCNRRTKPQCYMYRVFGLPVGKLEVVEKIKPSMKLFLYDFELKLLYVLWMVSTGFHGYQPALLLLVRFKICRDCLPLHESSFRHVIENNYQKGFKFNQELNKRQVGSLLSLFRPLTVSAPGSRQPVLLQSMQNQSRLPFPKDSCSQVLESQQIQQKGFQHGMGHVHPMDPNLTGLQLSYVQPVSEPQHILDSVPYPQQHYFRSTTNMGHSYPTMMTQVLLMSNDQYYLAQVQQPYAAGNPTQTVPEQYNSNGRYGTMGINQQQLATGNMYQLPLQREGETVQQHKGVIQYYNSDPSPAPRHVTPSVLSYMPTVGIPEAANGTLPLAYEYSSAGAAPTHH